MQARRVRYKASRGSVQPRKRAALRAGWCVWAGKRGCVTVVGRSGCGPVWQHTHCRLCPPFACPCACVCVRVLCTAQVRARAPALRHLYGRGEGAARARVHMGGTRHPRARRCGRQRSSSAPDSRALLNVPYPSVRPPSTHPIPSLHSHCALHRSAPLHRNAPIPLHTRACMCRSIPPSSQSLTHERALQVDAIGGRRFSEGTSADREIQRTLMELLSQLDGFDVVGKVKMIMATNRCVFVAGAGLEGRGKGASLWRGGARKQEEGRSSGVGEAARRGAGQCRAPRLWCSAPAHTLSPCTLLRPTRRTGLTCWTPRCCAPAAWTARLRSPCPTRTRGEERAVMCVFVCRIKKARGERADTVRVHMCAYWCEGWLWWARAQARGGSVGALAVCSSGQASRRIFSNYSRLYAPSREALTPLRTPPHTATGIPFAMSARPVSATPNPPNAPTTLHRHPPTHHRHPSTAWRS